jgi:hypothetical protein
MRSSADAESRQHTCAIVLHLDMSVYLRQLRWLRRSKPSQFECSKKVRSGSFCSCEPARALHASVIEFVRESGALSRGLLSGPPVVRLRVLSACVFLRGPCSSRSLQAPAQRGQPGEVVFGGRRATPAVGQGRRVRHAVEAPLSVGRRSELLLATIQALTSHPVADRDRHLHVHLPRTQR